MIGRRRLANSMITMSRADRIGVAAVLVLALGLSVVFGAAMSAADRQLQLALGMRR